MIGEVGSTGAWPRLPMRLCTGQFILLLCLFLIQNATDPQGTLKMDRHISPRCFKIISLTASPNIWLRPQICDKCQSWGEMKALLETGWAVPPIHQEPGVFTEDRKQQADPDWNPVPRGSGEVSFLTPERGQPKGWPSSVFSSAGQAQVVKKRRLARVERQKL